MAEKKLKQVFTHKLPTHEQDTSVRPGGGYISTDRPTGMTPIGYIGKYATPEEIGELVKRIESRRAKLPKFIYLICDKCGYRLKFPYGDRDIRPADPDYCLKCNLNRFIDGGKMREMTAKEAKQFDKDEEERQKRLNERTFRAALFARNQERQQHGLDPMTPEEFRAAQKRSFQAQFGAKK